jgi:hypothetical protein
MVQLQGKFPIIFVTFKDIKESTWDVSRSKLVGIISQEYARHSYLLDSDLLSDHEKDIFKNICTKTATTAEYHNSLLNLSQFLERYHQAKTIVLIDEYDSPIHAGYLNNYYSEIIEFTRGLLCAVLKDNSSLERGVVTGILRTAKEGIFSGLNNLKIFTLLDEQLADKFGFTEKEIEQLLHNYNLESIAPEFKSWYNGYLIGKTKIYNPWSALNCADRSGDLIPYWANTSDNGLIKKIIATSTTDIQDSCAELLHGNAVPNIEINDKMVLPGMINDSDSIWSLLLFSGYITINQCVLNAKGKFICSLVLPNRELNSLFDDLVTALFKEGLEHKNIIALGHALRDADGELFSILLSKFMIQSISCHDLHDTEPEKSYHLFVLGMLVVYSESYTVRSNRESGYGRFDIMLIPHDKNRPGIVIEFKKKDDKETMDQCANRALKQIKEKHYATELRSQGIDKIAFFGIACHNKEVLLKQENEDKEHA